MSILEAMVEAPLPQGERFRSSVRIKSLRKGDHLFHAGDVGRCVYFVTSGLIKLVYETDRADSWVKAFAPQGLCFASMAALSTSGSDEGSPGRASFSAIALTESRIEYVSYEVILNLAQHDIHWQRVISRAFELYGLRKERREMELLTLNAEERYFSFLKTFTSLESLIPQKDIASYIRITPVALSRIKARRRRRAEDLET